MRNSTAGSRRCGPRCARRRSERALRSGELSWTVACHAQAAGPFFLHDPPARPEARHPGAPRRHRRRPARAAARRCGDRRTAAPETVRDRRTLRLSPAAARRRAAGHHRAGRRDHALLPCRGRARGAARRRHVAVRRRAADGGRGGGRADADEPDPGHRLRRSLRHRAGRRHQYRHHQRGAGQGLLLRARSVEPARLHDRRQRQHELGRRALPEIRRHRQQSARA